MLSLLARLFVKNREQVASPAVRSAWGLLVSLYSIFLNLLLFAAKFLAGTLTGSLAMQADATNNLSDAGSSVVSLVSFKISAKPADRDHPFGHARIEYVASMIVSFLILFIGVELVRGSIGNLITPVKPTFNALAVVILSVSVLVKFYMAFFNRRVGKKIDSDVMRASAADSLSDMGATLAVLIANLSVLFLPETVSMYVDPVISLAVSVLILVAGLKILSDTKNSILGAAPTAETVATIEKMVAEYPDALGIHDMIVHSYGKTRTLASLHVEVDGKKDIFASHDMIDLIERRLFEEAGIECTIHLDPIITDDERVVRWRETVSGIVKKIDERLQIHDFRMVPGATHTNLIFDVAAPFEVPMSDAELKKQIATAVFAQDPTYFTVITIDRV
ncbi:MAG: cation transporter [Clostridia bacterium]|nr:cation transporter [Clostridia bacterium]